MDTISSKPKRKVVSVEETTIIGSFPTSSPVPVWKVIFECGHYVNLSKRKWKYPPTAPSLCAICKSQKGK